MPATRFGSAAAVVAIFAGAVTVAPARAASPAQDFDLRAGSASAPVSAVARAARRELRSALGVRGLLSVDRATGRPRAVGRLDGTLTGPSGATAAEVALKYLREHAAVYGLTTRQISDLEVGLQRRSAGGLVSVQLMQSRGGVRSIDSGVRAVVDARGRLVTLTGSPDPELDVAGPRAAVSSAQAAKLAAQASHAPDRAGEAAVSAVIFHVGPTARLGWRVLVSAAPRRLDDVLVDAASGAVVRVANRILSANAARVYPAWPGAPRGGSPTTVDLAPYLAAPAAPSKLEGPNAHAFTDATDVVPGSSGLNWTPAPGSDVGPSSGRDFVYPFHGFTLGSPPCPSSGPTCAWDPSTPLSWQANRKQDAVQLFWLVNAFHGHLAAAPIGFGAADGAFQGDDPVIAQSMDGADTAAGLPDVDHTDNASFQALPDGTPGSMQMYLFGGPPGPSGPDPFWSVSGADDASIVYHEYSHGLSNRLVTDADGFGALDSPQSGAMGEGWSDWYAFDELDREGNLLNAPGVADLRAGAYVEGPRDLARTEPLDCSVGDQPACPGTPSAGSGGYTFGDLGHVLGSPEVHADGEIWAQTLWQLRDALIADHGRTAGIARAERLVTDAMRLSPAEPSFLDERNAILQADAIDAPAGQDADRIWEVFAARGMGWFASIDSSGDVDAVEDFSPPPAPAAGSATVEGIVFDDAIGSGLSDVQVAFTGHDSGLGADLSAITDTTGAYAIANVPAGTYPKLRAALPAGYLGAVATGVTVPATGILTRDFRVRRNWASVAAGASVRSFSGSFMGRCGPEAALGDDPATGWSTDAPSAPSFGGPKHMVVALPSDITVTGLAIDPSPVCGDSAPAQLGAFRVRAARDDDGDPGDYTTLASGAFGPTDLGAARDVPLPTAAAGTRYLELQAIGNNGDPLFMDVSKLQVFGHPSTVEEGGGGTAAPEVITLPADGSATTASSATFRAAVTPHGAPTVVRIEFGLASDQPAFQTPDVPLPGIAPKTVRIAAGGLLPNSTYYYRAVATNARGTVTGDQLSLTTAPAPNPAPAAAVAGSAPAPPAPPAQSAVPRRASRATVKCERRRRIVTCTFTRRANHTDGARARLSRGGVVYARGIVRGRVLSMRARRDLRYRAYVLTITRGRGRAAIVKRRSVRL